MALCCPPWEGSQPPTCLDMAKSEEAWLVFPSPPAFNVTKASCCFQHMSLGRRRREAGCWVEMPKTPRDVKGRGTRRQWGARHHSADRG